MSLYIIQEGEWREADRSGSGVQISVTDHYAVFDERPSFQAFADSMSTLQAHDHRDDLLRPERRTLHRLCERVVCRGALAGRRLGARGQDSACDEPLSGLWTGDGDLGPCPSELDPRPT